MTRGRKKTPTELKKLNGTHRPDKENPLAPEPEVVEIPMPADLTDEARLHWPVFERQLRALNVLTAADESALVLMTETYAEWKIALDKVQEHGMLVKNANGTPQVSPFMSIQHKAHDRLLKLLCEYGMTPASRSKVNAAPAKPKVNAFLQPDK